MRFVYLICPVRGCDSETRERLDAYVRDLESSGKYVVHYPHRDVRQNGTEVEIVAAHTDAMLDADEIHVWWDGRSCGSHFDLGMAWAVRQMRKEVVSFRAVPPRIVLANPDDVVCRADGKCYANWLLEIAECQNRK